MSDRDAYNKSLEGYLAGIDKEIITFIAKGGFQTVDNSVPQEASHRIAIMEPSPTGLSCVARIATRWIAHRVFEQAQKKSHLQCLELYKQLNRQDRLRSAAGWFFEGYVHDWMAMGGSFDADPLPIEENNTVLNFQTDGSESLHYFKDANDLARQVRKENGHGIERDTIGKYFLPHNANFQSIDGLVFTDLDTLIVLQITLAKSHDIKAYGLKKLCDALPATIKKLNIVFVIPEDRISQYTRVQNVPAAADIRPNAIDLTIKQFRLVLTEKTIQLMVINRPFNLPASTSGEDESDSGDGEEAEESDSGDYDELDTMMGGTQ